MSGEHDENAEGIYQDLIAARDELLNTHRELRDMALRLGSPVKLGDNHATVDRVNWDAFHPITRRIVAEALTILADCERFVLLDSVTGELVAVCIGFQFITKEQPLG